MKKTIVIFFYLFLLTSIAKSQPWRGNNAFLDDVLKSYPQLDSGKIYYRIPLSLHIYLNPRENKEFLNKSIKSAIENLNSIYDKNHTGISFYLSGIYYLRDDKYLKVNYISENYTAGRKFHNPNSINIYYINVLEQNFIKETFYRGTYNHMSNSILIIRHASRTTLAHEIGHYLGLMHPHRNWNKGKLLQEPVSRSRKNLTGKRLCEIRGDYLSDTQAEPELDHYVNKNCEYTGNLKDAWGDEYHPNCNNIMSYLPYAHCRNVFTRQQKAVMLYTAEKKQKHHYWNATDTKNLIFKFDKYEPDNSMSMASPVCLQNPAIHTFHYVVKKNNKKICDSVDWIKFKLDTVKKVSFIFGEGDYSFPQIDLTLLNDSNRVFFSGQIKSADTVACGILPKGQYFLKIQKINNSKTEITSYSVTLQYE